MRISLAATLLLAIATVSAQDVESVGILPSERMMQAVAEKERNPFAKQEEKSVEQAVVDTESEESRIRQALGAMTVVGRTQGEGGWKVLLDNLILVQGEPVPPVVAGQTEQLRVASIYDGAIEIEWVEADPGGEPRRMFIPIDLAPRVRTDVGGAAAAAHPPKDESQIPEDPALF